MAVVDAFISFVDHYSEKRSGLERRIKDIGAMDEKRSGDERREGFQPLDRAIPYCSGLNGVFEQYMSDHEYGFPMPLITDGTKIIKAPFKIMQDWLGHDFKKLELSDVYMDKEARSRVLESVKEKEFTRFFPLIYKANGTKIVLDILITLKTNSDGQPRYYCFVDIED